MDAVGAMTPAKFQKDEFGTHEISNSMYIGTRYLIDCQPGQAIQGLYCPHPHSSHISLVCYNSSPYPNDSYEFEAYLTLFSNNLWFYKFFWWPEARDM